MSEPIRLNLGGATGPQLPGYTVVDHKTGQEVYPLAYPDASVDEIRASHVLEHISHRTTVHVVKDWARALKPGGVMKIAVPNADWCIERLEAGEGDKYPIEAYLFGSQADGSDFHAAMFNEGKLRQLMELAGLTDIKPWVSEVQDCASLPVSLNLQGTKPATPPVNKISAVMSVPRLGFTENFAAVESVVRSLRMPCRIQQGAFWGSTLTRAIQETIEEDLPDAILFIDYDSVFATQHVVELTRLMRENPNADAIAATQIGRDRDSVLLTIKGKDGKNQPGVLREDVERDLLPVSTAHFGLTMIRVSSLSKLEKPWFVGVPDDKGEWGDGRTDDDIWFWRQAEKAGWGVYQANKVRIGHLQLMVTWPTPDLEPIHQYVTEYRKSGAPAEAKTA